MKRRYELFALVLSLLIIFANITSSAAAVAPSITTQPANATVKLGATASFTVVASGTAPLSYQWYKNSNIINGATSSKYTTPSTTDADNGSYFTVTVTNSAGGTPQTNPAYLSVVDPPIIEEQPSSETVTVPGVADFNAGAYASQPLTCQWYKNGHPIAGANECYEYITEEVTTADNGAAFTVVFTETVNGVAISTASRAAILTVKGSTTSGTYPIVGNWSGTATIIDAQSNKTTTQATAAFSQTSYSITGTVVYTDENGIPSYGTTVASLNGQNVYVVTGSDPTVNIAGGFSANLLTLNIIAAGATAGDGSDPETGGGGSGTLTVSADHKSLTGNGTDTDGDTFTWNLTREK